nr:MAG TPA: hypothetical protein [Caudoviricetes sp.]
MKISREEKKIEALGRMKRLGVFPETIKQFEQEDLVSISEPPVGAFFWVENEELEEMRRFEQRYKALVYVIIRSYTTIGKMDSYLYVSDYKDEWQRDRDALNSNEAFAYVINRDMPDCSEFGSIGIRRTIAGGLARTW